MKTESQTLNCESLRSFNDVIVSMQALSEFPIRLSKLYVHPRQANNYGGENFQLSQLTVSYDEFGIDWNRATKIIYTHEIGHLILDSYLSQKIPVLKDLAIVKERNARFGKAIVKVEWLKQTDPACRDENSACNREIQKIIAASGVDLTGPRPQIALQNFSILHKAELEKLYAIQNGYHELFADLTQALVFSHPAINNQASRLFGIRSEACRTFNETLPVGFSSADPHCSLSAIRTQLWNEFVTPNLSNKKWILAKLADVIQREISTQMYTRPLSPSEQGVRLLQMLRVK